MRTSAGISGFGSNSSALVIVNNSATAKPASHHSPFVILITGSAIAAHNKPRTIWRTKSSGSVRIRLLM
jgi:hypothetical protein